MPRPETEFFVASSRIGVVEVLSGIAFSDTELVVGTAGMRALKKTKKKLVPERFRNGRFSAIIEEEGGFTIFSDCLGQDTVFYYADEQVWAASNSFFLLISELKELNVKIKVNENALVGFLIGTQGLYGGQLLSGDTIVVGARVLGLRECLKVRRTQNDSSWEVKVEDRHEICSSGSYEDLLHQAVHSAIRRIEALYRFGYTEVMVDLSGGYDSRMCLGMVLNSQIPRSDITIDSKRSKKQDFLVASKIIDRFSLRSYQENPEGVAADGRFRNWILGCLGVFLPVYAPGRYVSSNTLRVNGGSFRARQYTNLPLSRRLKKLGDSLDVNQQSILHKEFKKSLLHAGIEAERPDVLAKHYIHYRARYLCGLNTFRSLNRTLLTPLLSTEFIEACDALGWGAYRSAKFEYDVLNALDPVLASLPFDRPEKNFDDNTYGFPSVASLAPGDSFGRELDLFGKLQANKETGGGVEQKSFGGAFWENYWSVRPLVEQTPYLPKVIFERADKEIHMSLGSGATNASLILSVGKILSLSQKVDPVTRGG